MEQKPIPNGTAAAEKLPSAQIADLNPLFITICSFVPVDNPLGHLKTLQREESCNNVPLNYKDKCKLTLVCHAGLRIRIHCMLKQHGLDPRW